MEKQTKAKRLTQKHTLFKETINLTNFQKQSTPCERQKKEIRHKSYLVEDSETFDVKKHFKYLKENHASFQQLNYQNQNPIQNTYLNRGGTVVSRKQRTSCPLIDDLIRQPSIRKVNLNNLKVKDEPQVAMKKSVDTYWALKEVSSKMKNWMK